MNKQELKDGYYWYIPNDYDTVDATKDLVIGEKWSKPVIVKYGAGKIYFIESDVSYSKEEKFGKFILIEPPKEELNK